MIELINLRKEYPNVTPIKNITATINKGDVISVIGPSGTGKSTLLRMINLLERPTSGRIIIDGEDVTAEGYPLYKVRQKAGMVFQSFNLFNHMTVIENVCFGPVQIKKENPGEAYDRGMKILSKVGLAEFAFSYPKSLSGGQKQRAAIARTIANRPEIILFDEPTSALDPAMAGEVQGVIRSLAAEGYTMMLVTHDMKFARKVANRVFYLDEGGIYDEGTPEEIFVRPEKEKTQAFVMKLKDFQYEITAESRDYFDLQSKLDTFCHNMEIPYAQAEKVKSIVEEIGSLFEFIVQMHPKENMTTEIVVSYSEQKGEAEVISRSDNVTEEVLDECGLNSQMAYSLLKHYADDITYDERHIIYRVRS